MVRRRSLLRNLGGGVVLLAGCLGGSGSDLEDTDGDGVVDSEDYAPRDPEVQRKSDVQSTGSESGDDATETSPEATDTPTPTSQPSNSEAAFLADFEDGDLAGWSPLELNDNNRSFDGNNWSVTGDAISGDYSMRVLARGDSLENIVATDNRVLEMSRDFTFSFAWRTPDPSNRGIGFGLVKRDGTDLTDIPNEEIWSELFRQNTIGFGMDAGSVSEEGSPFKGNGGFSMESFSRESYAAGTVHTATIVKRGAEATLYWDREEILTSDVLTEGTYRLCFRTSGTWGNETTATIDDVRVVYE
jgi:hypothetical protein